MNSDSINLLLLRAHVEEDDRSYNLEGIGLIKTELYAGKMKEGVSPKMGAKQMPPSFYLSTIMIMAILLASRILTSSVHPRPIFLFSRLNVSLARSGRSGPANLSYLCMPPEFISVHLFLIS